MYCIGSLYYLRPSHTAASRPVALPFTLIFTVLERDVQDRRGLKEDIVTGIEKDILPWLCDLEKRMMNENEVGRGRAFDRGLMGARVRERGRYCHNSRTCLCRGYVSRREFLSGVSACFARAPKSRRSLRRIV
ncbi:hypothetical protein EVAR_23713_1 [Eumeta japonica]|uniref:Uncharacterized protein n=1 Tax=Eumeta variegata TaxID=151549 RepID=A0A4C1VIY5_EUMVA|nr:hypothetical protein EVAR_23713_1 [Eumeta japonica]